MSSERHFEQSDDEPATQPDPTKRTPRPRGRPSRLTAEVHLRMVSMIGKGALFKDAAIACDIRPATAHEWMARGLGVDPDRSPKAVYVAFARDIRRAAAAARVVASTRLFDENPGRWLRQVDPTSWGPSGTAHQEPDPHIKEEDER
jgi:hypothetical protein